MYCVYYALRAQVDLVSKRDISRAGLICDRDYFVTGISFGSPLFLMTISFSLDRTFNLLWQNFVSSCPGQYVGILLVLLLHSNNYSKSVKATFEIEKIYRSQMKKVELLIEARWRAFIFRGPPASTQISHCQQMNP